MSKNSYGYNDPTASIAIGHVMKEEKRLASMLKNRDGEPFAEHQKFGDKAYRPWDDVLKEFDKIDKGKRD